MNIQGKTAKLATAALLASVSITTAQEPVVNKGGTKVELYGQVQLNTVWEDRVVSTDAPNWSYYAPVGQAEAGSRTLMNVNHSRVGLNLVGPQNEGESEVSGKFEVDFNNSNSRNINGVGGLRIRHSYGQVKFGGLGMTLLMGQTYDVISPRDPAVLSEGSGNYTGNLATRRPQVRLTQELGPLEIAVAALDDRGADAPKAPAVQGRLGVKFPAGWASEDESLEFGVSGHFAKEKNTDLAEDQPYEKVPRSWSVNADLNLPVISIINLSGEFFYGQNLKHYGNGSLGLSAHNSTGKDYGIKTLGGWANLGVKLPANLAFNGGMGIEAIQDPDEVSGGSRTHNMGIYSNLRYYFIPNAYLGVEYFRIDTEFKSDAGEGAEKGAVNRVELAFQYAFK